MNHSHVVQNSTARVRAYAARQQAIEALKRSTDPADKKVFAEMKRQVLAAVSTTEVEGAVERALERRAAGGEVHTRVSPGDVHAVTFMANMSVQYANEMYIGDELLPMVPCDKLTDEYVKYGKRDRLAYPDDSMSGRSRAPQVTAETRTAVPFTCKARGLSNWIERKTIDNEDAVFDEMMDLSAHVSEGMAFNREKRAMAILTNSANYGSNTSAIAAGDRWDTDAGGDPVKAIRTAKENVWHGNGPSKLVGFCTLPVYITLCTNPTILDVLKYTKGGYPPKAMLAELFELDDLLVAKAWEDTNNSGQTESISRMTTAAIFGIVRVAQRPSKRNVSFGYTFRFKGEISNRSWFEEKEGTRGVYWNQQTTDELAQVVAADAGWLYTTVTG